MEISTDLKMKIAELQDAILQTHPRLPLLLKDIHTTLKNQPETVTLLTEDEIAVIVNGLKQQTKTVITQAAISKRVPAKKSINLDDL